MNKTLRIALCGLEGEAPDQVPFAPVEDKVMEGEGKTIMMSGPLSEIYTKALSVVYAKKDQTTQSVSIESQANDAIAAMRIARSALNGGKVDSVATVGKDLQSNTVTGSPANASAFVIQASAVNTKTIVAAQAELMNSDGLGNGSRRPEVRPFFIVEYDGLALTPGATDGLKLVEPEFNNRITAYSASNPAVLALESQCKKLGIELVFGIDHFISRLAGK